MAEQMFKNIARNKEYIHELFPITKSFDFMERDLFLGKTKAYLLSINGFTQTAVLQQILSDLQNPLFNRDEEIMNLDEFVSENVSYIQASSCKEWERAVKSILSGTAVLWVDGFDHCIILDTRTYPTRSTQEPDTERVTRGAKDGFVESMLTNTTLIRRRIRNPKLTFSLREIGEDSKTDIAICYIEGKTEETLLEGIEERLEKVKATSLTMGSKSLEELLVPKKWYHPLPNVHLTERPDVACSFLEEGYMVIVVDNSPMTLILPCSIFQFTQSPEDYYKSQTVGNYVRLMRFFCLFLSMFLMPTFLLLGGFYPTGVLGRIILSTPIPAPKLFALCLIMEVAFELFRYSAAHTSTRFSGALSIIGGLLIGDAAIQLNWASIEVIFYGAVTMLATLTLSSLEFAEGIRMYRIFLLVLTGVGGTVGFAVGVLLITISVIKTPTFGHRSFLWPLIPLNRKALSTLLFRYPTYRAQPSKVWKK